MESRSPVPAVISVFAMFLIGGCSGPGEEVARGDPPAEVTVTQTVPPQPTPPETMVSPAAPVPTENTGAVTATGPGILADLTPVDPAGYYGQDSGSLAGYRFASPTGNINCHLSEIPVACHVREHAPWPAEGHRPDGIDDTPSSTVGWMGEMNLTGPPMHWRQQGTFPATGVGNILEYGNKITVQRTIDGVSSQLTCGSRITDMTCVIDDGEHGFTVSRESYSAW